MVVSKKIIIKVSDIKLEAELNDTETAVKIYNALPIDGKVNTWGEEIYFEIPVKMKQEKPVSVVELGDIGYWPAGNCFCIFFGKTPISTDKEIRPASAVTIIGKVIGDPKIFKKVKDGEKVRLEKIE